MAEKDSEYLKEVQAKFKEMLESSWPRMFDYLVSCGMGEHMIVSDKVAYLLQMQLMSCVVGAKQNELARDHPMQSVSAA